MLVASRTFVSIPLMTGDNQNAAGTAAGRARISDERGERMIQLVARMAAGDQDALASLYDETSSLINGLLLRILEYQEDAEEALLDVYLKAWKNASSYSIERGSVRSWLVVMARTIAIDRIRSRKALAKTIELDGETPIDLVSTELSPEEETQEEQRRRIIQKVLGELPREQREVLDLAYFGGLTHSELAAKLGQPLGTIKSRIRMALQRLKAALEEEAI